jgi:hypothetical protein
VSRRLGLPRSVPARPPRPLIRPACPPIHAESARLLGVLIRCAPRLVLPYAAPVLRALVAKLQAAGSGAPPAAPAATAAKPSSKSTAQGEGAGQGCLHW